MAGRRGLIHYSATSGRWKVFTDVVQEQAFVVKGGLLWFHHVLVAAVEVGGSHQVCSSSSRIIAFFPNCQ
jgi:RAB6A-GEF complex partner protein 1